MGVFISNWNLIYTTIKTRQEYFSIYYHLEYFMADKCDNLKSKFKLRYFNYT